MNLYSFYDTERKVYSPLFPGEDDVIAKRQYLLNITKSPFWKQCELRWLGHFWESEEQPLSSGEVTTIPISDDEVNQYWEIKDSMKSDK